MSKFKKAIEDNKKFLIIILVLWIVLELFLIAPFVVAKTISASTNDFLYNFIGNFGKEISSFNSIFKVVKVGGGGEFLRATLWLTITFLIFTTIGIIRSKSKNKFKDIENGSSDWCRGGEQYNILSKNKGIILAEDNYLPTNKRGNINVLVVGGSGSGKSASYSKPNAHQMLGSYVFTDPKGELYDDTAGYLKKNGYNIKVLNLVNPTNSDGYNPLAHIQSNIDVDVIAHTIVHGQEAEGGSKDAFWDDNAEMLLKALIYYIISTRPEEERNLVSCAELVRAANSGGSNLLTELMNQLPYENPGRTYYKNVEMVATSEKTYSSILSTLQSKLGKFDSQEIAELTSTDTIDFAEIAERKTAVYVISSDTHTTYNFLLTIFFSQMIQQLYDHADRNGGRLKVPAFFILDEFANIGQIPDFDKKISTSRSRGISFSVILQNLDQLKAVYEKSYETIIGNCDTHVFLGSNSGETVEYFSKQLGETTITRDSRSISRDRNFSKQGYSTSDSVMGRALMTPDELRRMDNDYCIIFEKGLKPIKAKKYYYFEKPMGRDLARYKIDHNNFDSSVRGEWRKFNPMNPYVDDKEIQEQNLKIESLDDLFEDDTPEEKNTIDEIPYAEEDVPILPIENNTEEDDLFTKDLQAELEAKFDELFGPVDDTNNNN